MPVSPMLGPADSQAGCSEIVPIFSGLPKLEMAEVASITREKSFGKSESIYYPGENKKSLFVIHSGRVKLSRLSPGGKAQIIRVLGPGEFMGELSIFNGLNPNDFAEALEPCTMCIIEGEKLKNLMNRYPSIALKVMEELSQRLEKAETLIEDINLHSAEHRLADALLELSNGKPEFKLPLTKGDFASQLGMTQETLSRKLSLFRDNGYIDLKGQRTIFITNVEGLSALRDPYP